LIRPNGNNSTVALANYIFTLDGAANAFAEQTHQLAKIFVGDTHPVLLKLFVSPEGKTNILRPKEKPAGNTSNETSESTEPTENAPQVSATPPQPIEKPKTILEKDMNDDGDSADEPIQKTSKAKAPPKEDIDVEEKEVQPKPSKKTSKVNKSQEETEDADESDDKNSKPSRKSKNEAKQDVEEKEEPVIEKSNDICEQIMQVIQSGKTKRFADLEGKVLNEQNKTNESRLKLKGAKRNYLSNYKNKRAFIAEYKVLTDNELIMIEFDKLQTQLEDCLDGNWDNEDRSGDDEYSELQGDVRDVEYKNTNDPTAPSLRIIMLSDGKKYVLFVRIS